MKQIDKHAYGPWALVTGASSGIGEEFARQVAASGINVSEPITPEQAADEALTALAAGRMSTLERADMSGAFEDMKGAVVEMIRARLAASQPAH
jgi:NAD(P)-dependent dehydrogenase (short-subunit alcohol dehydrogenase family)